MGAYTAYLKNSIQAGKQMGITCPNGGRRNKAEAAKLKAMGVRKGIPDLFLPIPRQGYHGLYIETKKIKNGKVSPDQQKKIPASKPMAMPAKSPCAKVFGMNIDRSLFFALMTAMQRGKKILLTQNQDGINVIVSEIQLVDGVADEKPFEVVKIGDTTPTN